MTYALLVFDRDESLAGLSEQERGAIYAEYEQFARTDGLRGYRLHPPDRATTLRIRGDGEELSRGPVTDRSLPLAGFYLVKTDDPQRAAELARQIPASIFRAFGLPRTISAD